MPKLFFLIPLCLPLAVVRADSIELRDGTEVEGRILSVTPDRVLMDVAAGANMREEKSFPRTEVARIRKAGPDDIAFEEVAAVTVPPTADNPAVYDMLLEEKVRPFMKNFAYSRHMPEARRLAATLEAERARVASGEVKIDGQWIASDASPAERAELGGRIQLAKMKEAVDPVTALAAFEVLEKNHGASSSYPSAVKVALASFGPLRANLLRARADLDRSTREREQGLQLASADRRLQMEQGIAQEKAAIQAQVERAKQAGSRWLPLLPDPAILDDLSRSADSEQARLAKLDTATMEAGVAAARQARTLLEAGDLAGAKAELAQAQKFWGQYVLLASLAESLQKAEIRAAEAARGKPAAAQP